MRTPTRKASPTKDPTKRPAKRAKRWSAHVTATSHALDLEPGVFRKRTPRAIAASVLRSARRSHTRKSSPYRSAMSMITFYINRAGHALPKERRAVLERAKDELRAMAHTGS
jgi:hypothetical protein